MERKGHEVTAAPVSGYDRAECTAQVRWRLRRGSLGGGSPIGGSPILQQYWTIKQFSPDHVLVGIYGEWRDVPTEEVEG